MPPCGDHTEKIPFVSLTLLSPAFSFNSTDFWPNAKSSKHQRPQTLWSKDQPNLAQKTQSFHQNEPNWSGTDAQLLVRNATTPLTIGIHRNNKKFIPPIVIPFYFWVLRNLRTIGALLFWVPKTSPTFLQTRCGLREKKNSSESIISSETGYTPQKRETNTNIHARSCPVVWR